MCNLYSMIAGQVAYPGNLEPYSGIFPDYRAPIVRVRAGVRELVLARWGMPTPAGALVGRKTDPGVTNAPNLGECGASL